MANVESNAQRTLIPAAATTVIKNKPGYIGKLVVTAVGSASTITIYDNASAGSGEILWLWVTANGIASIDLQARAKNGITIVHAADAVAYVTWS